MGRYGRRGSFWRENPGLPREPIREWQIWNEPHLTYYWRNSKPRPWARTYTALLKASDQVLHGADPGAKVVLGGLAYYSWLELRSLYAAGARRWFDVAAIHPYTMEVGNVAKIVRYTRELMNRHGDRAKRIYVTETSWPSARGSGAPDFGFNVSRAAQATKLTADLRLLARRRRSLGLARVYWFKWLSPDTGTANPFDYAGLRTLGDGTPRSKPALRAFARVVLTLEGRR